MAVISPKPGEYVIVPAEKWPDGYKKSQAQAELERRLIDRTQEKIKAATEGQGMAHACGMVTQGPPSFPKSRAAPAPQNPHIEEAMDIARMVAIVEKSEGKPEAFQNKMLRLLAVRMAADLAKGQGFSAGFTMELAKQIYDFVQSGSWEKDVTF